MTPTEIKNNLTDLKQILTSLDLMSGAKKQSNGFLVCCPWHADKDASCSVQVESGHVLAHCFGCDASGSVLDLIMASRGCSISEACKFAEGLIGEMPGHYLSVQSQPIARVKTYPSEIEVRDLWERATRVDKHPGVAAWLKSRSLSPTVVADMDLVRALPVANLPSWAQSWAGSYDCLVPMYDASGQLRSVRARLTKGNGPKVMVPKGYATDGLVMRTIAPLAALTVISEGEPDWLTMATRYPEHCHVGITNGAWTAELAETIADDSKVIIATDPDDTGEKYAKEIVGSLRGRCDVMRIKIGEVDMNEAHKAGRLPKDLESASSVVEACETKRPRTATEAWDSLRKRRENPALAVSSGLGYLDTLTDGGIRQGDFIGIAAKAKGGKSALMGQVLYDAVVNGAIGIYVSVEMNAEEIIARYAARNLFGDANANPEAPISYSQVLHGTEHRSVQDTTVRDKITSRIGGLSESFERLGGRLLIEQVMPGATAKTVRDLVVAARKEHGSERLCVVFIDPLQRLHARKDDSGELTQSAVDKMNATEVERLGLMLQQVKQLVDDPSLNMAVLFTSDTTKDGASGELDGATGFRGSYMINHVATVLLAIRKSAPIAAIYKRTSSAGKTSEISPEEQPIEAADIDRRVLDREDAKDLGAKCAWIQCEGNRHGKPEDTILIHVPGAMAFFDGRKPYVEPPKSSDKKSQPKARKS